MNNQKQLSPDNVEDVLNRLPKELKDKLYERLEHNSTITRLRKEYTKATQQLALTRAATIDKKLKSAIYNVVSDAMEEYKQEYMTIDKVFGHMEDEDSKTACYLFITLFFLTDMVESAIMDLDSLCKKINPDFSFQIGRDLLDVLKLSKAKMRLFDKNFTFFSYDKWGDEVDKLYLQTVKRAGIFTRYVFKEERKKHEEEKQV